MCPQSCSYVSLSISISRLEDIYERGKAYASIDAMWHYLCGEIRGKRTFVATPGRVAREATPGSFPRLLERPPLAGHMEEVRYKIYLAGRSGVGKSATVAKLTGNDIPKTHMETPG
ncbi:hypothetical protein DPMN_124813 [Dreissena polymorpha]|uniref:Uncharacterized protein n=1 Tax=Dreissena polymorpha TaxID=45954 RepID=A0A9D4GWB9_DREPO|nr:hypothetical protein DPMN_124813 [Dreissena polymorpha]